MGKEQITVYLSGPITGRDRDDFLNHFIKEEQLLKKNGFEVVNPAAEGMLRPKSFTHENHMAVDMALLKQCNWIHMLKEWENSKGAREELFYALAHNYPVTFEETIK